MVKPRLNERKKNKFNTNNENKFGICCWLWKFRPFHYSAHASFICLMVLSFTQTGCMIQHTSSNTRIFPSFCTSSIWLKPGRGPVRICILCIHSFAIWRKGNTKRKSLLILRYLQLLLGDASVGYHLYMYITLKVYSFTTKNACFSVFVRIFA